MELKHLTIVEKQEILRKNLPYNKYNKVYSTLCIAEHSFVQSLLLHLLINQNSTVIDSAKRFEPPLRIFSNNLTFQSELLSRILITAKNVTFVASVPQKIE